MQFGAKKAREKPTNWVGRLLHKKMRLCLRPCLLRAGSYLIEQRWRRRGCTDDDVLRKHVPRCLDGQISPASLRFAKTHASDIPRPSADAGVDDGFTACEEPINTANSRLYEAAGNIWVDPEIPFVGFAIDIVYYDNFLWLQISHLLSCKLDFIPRTNTSLLPKTCQLSKIITLIAGIVKS